MFLKNKNIIFKIRRSKVTDNAALSTGFLSGQMTCHIFSLLVCCASVAHSSKIVSKRSEPRHEISNNVLCATSKSSDQPAHTRSLIRAFASRLNIL